MPKCDFNKVAKQIALRHGCSPVNFLYISRALFPKNISGRMLLCIDVYIYKAFLFYWSLLVANFETDMSAKWFLKRQGL